MRAWLNRISLAVAVALVMAPLADAQVSIYNKNAVAKQFTVVNSGTAATDNAYLEAKVSGASAGDPHVRLTIPGGTSWYMGVDNSDADGWKLGTGTAVGTVTYAHMTTGGILHLGSIWETPVATTAIVQTMAAGNTFSIVRNTVNDVELAFGVNASQGIINTQSNSELILGANNGTQLHLTTDGRLFGTALHNNGGAVTGTANQYVASGTYTPTLTNTTNVAASTARKCQWIRVGNVVNVSGSVDIDPTAAGATAMGLSLPIASNLVNATDLGGTAAADGAIAIEAAAVKADGANDRASIEFTTVNIANHTVWFTFQYEVL